MTQRQVAPEGAGYDDLSTMKRSPVLFLSALLLVATAACSKSAPPEGALTNDLRVAPGAPVGKRGVPDDGVKPLPLSLPLVGKAGIPDDSIKPVGASPVPPPARR